MATPRIPIDHEKLAEFCRQNRIRKLSLYGSVLRDDFRPDSNVDVLVEFEPNTRLGLKFYGLAIELDKLFGRYVDLRTPEEFGGLLPVERLRAEVQYERT